VCINENIIINVWQWEEVMCIINDNDINVILMIIIIIISNIINVWCSNVCI